MYLQLTSSLIVQIKAFLKLVDDQMLMQVGKEL